MLVKKKKCADQLFDDPTGSTTGSWEADMDGQDLADKLQRDLAVECVQLMTRLTGSDDLVQWPYANLVELKRILTDGPRARSPRLLWMPDQKDDIWTPITSPTRKLSIAEPETKCIARKLSIAEPETKCIATPPSVASVGSVSPVVVSSISAAAVDGVAQQIVVSSTVVTQVDVPAVDVSAVRKRSVLKPHVNPKPLGNAKPMQFSPMQFSPLDVRFYTPNHMQELGHVMDTMVKKTSVNVQYCWSGMSCGKPGCKRVHCIAEPSQDRRFQVIVSRYRPVKGDSRHLVGSEMCKNLILHGICRDGDLCNFRHYTKIKPLSPNQIDSFNRM
jgi:hypothetical protein